MKTLLKFHTLNLIDSVLIRNGHKLTIKCVGSGILSTKSGTFLSLKALLYTPQSFTNLLDVYKLCCDNLVFIEFHPYLFLIEDLSSKRVVLKDGSENALYKLNG